MLLVRSLAGKRNEPTALRLVPAIRLLPDGSPTPCGQGSISQDESGRWLLTPARPDKGEGLKLQRMFRQHAGRAAADARSWTLSIRVEVVRYEPSKTVSTLIWENTMSNVVNVPCLVARSFTEGDTITFVKVRVDDDTIQAEALWLENHDRPERAYEVLEAYCRR